jgi:2,3-diketo-5-methylthio-1-phosphopentane phosphatase
MQVLCDFDGTISRQDSTDLVLAALADPEWRELQGEWEAGRISGAACMRGQVAMIRGSAADLDAVLDGADLDPGFPAFVDWCAARAIDLRIVSDGVDYFIDHILTRHGLQHLAVTTNRLVGGPGDWNLEHPRRPDDCASGAGVCKCSALNGGPEEATVVFVGDGRSDFCVASKADILFAKGALAAHAEAAKRAYLPFDTFRDVQRTLDVLLAGRQTTSNKPPPAGPSGLL